MVDSFDKALARLLVTRLKHGTEKVEAWLTEAKSAGKSLTDYVAAQGIVEPEALKFLSGIAKQNTKSLKASDTVSSAKDGQTLFAVNDGEDILPTDVGLYRQYVPNEQIEWARQLGGDQQHTEVREISMLFCDIRNYTNASASMSATEVGRMINDFLSDCVQCVHECKGFVYQYVGDQIIALFNAPLKRDSHAVLAVRCAVMIQKKHQDRMRYWESHGMPAPKLGIGINTGDVVMGNIGPVKRRAFGIIGHNVNLASRMCSAALGDEILITPYVLDLLKPALHEDKSALRVSAKFRKGDMLEAKGIDESVQSIRVEWQ